MASKTFSSAVCTTGNAACQGCTKDHLPGGSKVSGRRCLYLPPQNGDSAPQLGGVAVTPSAGGLSACSPRYYDVGACNAAKNGRAVAISCASVVAASADKASLSGGEGKLCCADNDHAGFMPGCKAGSAQVVQFNVGAPKPGTCMPGCKPGYRLLGGQNVTKCENGVLSQAVCVPNGCTAAQVRIPPMLGGIGSCNGAMAHGQTCMPACLGKTIVTGTSVCLAGKFISATCEASCGVPPVPGNATAGNCIAVLGPSKTCKPRCNPGFTLIPSGGTSCSSSARLSLARCKAQPCDTSRATPANGRPGSCCSLRGCEIPSGAVCMPECERGYALERPTRCVAGTLTQPVSRCLPSPCNMSGIPPPRNGTRGDCPAVLASGARCLPSCDVGFSLAPRAGTACRTGTLSRARCVPDPCDASVPVAHGELGDCTQVLPTGMTCQPACHAGYEASGASYCYAGRLTPASCEVALAGLCGRETEMQLAKEELKHQDECSRSMAGAATVTALIYGGLGLGCARLFNSRAQRELRAASAEQLEPSGGNAQAQAQAQATGDLI